MEMLDFLRNNISLETLFIIFSWLIAFDVLTGGIKAWKNGNFMSRSLRDGLFGSLGEIVLLTLLILLTKIIPVTNFIAVVIMTFMVLKEFESIIENLIVIGVKLPNWLIKGLKVYGDKLDNLEEIK